MDFFRREKDPNEEWRRTRQSFDDRQARGSENEDSSEWSGEASPPTPQLTYTSRKPQEPEPPADPLATYREGATMVGKDSAFSGTLRSNSNLFIEGEFDGELEARATVVIAETAQVKAAVRAQDVIVAGTLDGTVDARGRFHAMPTANVSAEVTSASLKVEQGSQINCHFAMKVEQEDRR
jgi:cytoskeletal protein CcmA (bactofilin family)